MPNFKDIFPLISIIPLRHFPSSFSPLQITKQKMEENATVSGSRQLNMKLSFKRSLRPLLTTIPLEEFRKELPSFTEVEQQRLQRLLIQVITTLHGGIEDGFESLLLQTQACKILDTVEELVEEHNLNPLRSEKSNVEETAQVLLDAKKNELHYLTERLAKAEEEKRKLSEHLELLKKEKQDLSGSGASNLVHELRTGIKNYVTRNQG